jgi:hypothetical protein
MADTKQEQWEWRRLFAYLTVDQRERLLKILQEQRVGEAAEAELLRGDAERLRLFPEKRRRSSSVSGMRKKPAAAS